MKTISMPLEEYEAEVAKLKNGLNDQSYQRGALDTLQAVREQLFQPGGRLKGPDEITKAITVLVEEIKKDSLKKLTTFK